MLTSARAALAAAVLLSFVLRIDSASAAAQRTFVAVTGSDANPCAIAAPCRSFAAAIAQTAPGGEVIVLESGAYGRVTITQPVTIEAPTVITAGSVVITNVYISDNGHDGVWSNGVVDVVIRDSVSARNLSGVSFFVGARRGAQHDVDVESGLRPVLERRPARDAYDRPPGYGRRDL